MNLTVQANINSAIFTSTGITGTGSGYEIYDTSYSQLNYNNENYIWTDSTGVNFEVTDGSNTYTAQFATNGNATFPEYIIGNYFSGDGGYLSNIAAGNIVGTVANATYADDAGNANIANTVSVSAQPNITSVGTLISLDVTGNANANIVNANYFYGDGSNLTAVAAQSLFVGDGSNISATYYPLFTQDSTGNVDVEIDTFGNLIDYVPSTGTLSFRQANVEVVTNGGGEFIDLDGSNNRIRLSVTGAANAVSVTDVAMVATVPMQLPVYASNAARDSAVTSPSAGMMIFVTGQGMQVSNGSAWNNVAGTA